MGRLGLPVRVLVCAADASVCASLSRSQSWEQGVCETLLSELLGLVMALAPAGRHLLLSGICGGPGWSHCCPLLILGLLRISKADQNRWGGRGRGKSLKKADKLPKVILTLFLHGIRWTSGRNF